MGGRKGIQIVSACVFLLVLSAVPFHVPENGGPGGTRVQAASVRRVGTLRELQNALISQEAQEIFLKNDISIDRIVVTNGKKTIHGNGKYQLFRKTGVHSYRETLFLVQNGILRLKHVTLNGGGSRGDRSGVTGKLIETAGTVILEEGAILRSNQNTATLTDGGGGITVHAGGKAVMKAGSKVSGHVTITGGSGIRVEKGGSFIMEGGTITGNAVLGQGTGNDFDGRGGAIHNRGTVWIQGGIISGNRAVGYRRGQAEGGYGGAVYNQGLFRMTGGMIRENKADLAGDGIYTNETGVVSMEGGTVSGAEYGIYFAAGSVRLSGGFQVNRIYVKGEHYLTADQRIYAQKPCEICPEIYREGKLLIRILSGEKEEQVMRFFTLKKRGRFLLEPGEKGLYIGRERYQIKFEANGGVGTMEEQTIYVGKRTRLSRCRYRRDGYGFAGWAVSPKEKVEKADIVYPDGAFLFNKGAHGDKVILYALWVKKPYFSGSKNKLSFYEGEYVGAKVLLYGMEAWDECDGNITNRIVVDKVLLPDGTEYDFRKSGLTGADHIGTGDIFYRVTNSFGISEICQRKYEILPNAPPEITAHDRYFFTNEYSNGQRNKLKEEILCSLRITDDVESEEQLRNKLKIAWKIVNMEKAGEYEVTCRVRDQYGHRYYMEHGTEEAYGEGKQAVKSFILHVIDPVNDGTVVPGRKYVRFISREYVDLLPEKSVWRQKEYKRLLEESFQKQENNYEQVWVISKRAKRQIKEMMRGRDDPFSKETNDLFLKQFSYLKKEEDGFIMGGAVND